MLIIYRRAMLWPQVRLSSGESKPVEVAWPVNEPRIVSHHGQGATHLPGEVPSTPPLPPVPRASCAAWGLWALGPHRGGAEFKLRNSTCVWQCHELCVVPCQESRLKNS